MKWSLEGTVRKFLRNNTLSTPRDRFALLGENILLLPLSIASGSVPLSLLNHMTSFAKHIVKQPSQNSLEETLSYYSIPFSPKKERIHWGAAIASPIIAAAAMYPGLGSDFSYFVSHIDSIAPQELVRLAMMVQTMYSTSKVFYITSRRTLALTSATKANLIKGLMPYFSEKFQESKESNVAIATHLLKTEPKKGLRKIIELYYDKDIAPSTFTQDPPRDIVLHYYGKDALAAFVNSLIGYEMDAYQPYFFKKAVKVASEEKDVSTLSLLALYDYKKNNSTETFREQVRLLQEKKNIVWELLATGTFTNVHTLGEDTDDPSHLSLVQKISTDTKRLQEKYDLEHFLCTTKYVQSPIDIQVHGDIAILSEIRIRNPSLYEKLKDDPSLYDEAYFVLGRLQEKLQKSNFIFEPLNIEDKYLNNSLSKSKKYERSIHEARELFADLGEYKPILDFHTHNLLVNDDTLVDIDIENKGSGAKIFDIVNLLYYTPDAVPANTLEYYKNSILDMYQEEIKKEDDYMQALFLRGMGLRRDSFMRARKTPKGFSDRNSIQKVIGNMAGVFAEYAQNSYQKKIAQEQLQITESLLKSI